MLLLILACCALIARIPGNQQVPLYPGSFQEEDLQEIRFALAYAHIAHSGAISVPFQDLSRARAVVAEKGLPRFAIVPWVRVEEPGEQKMRKEGEITEALREMSWVRDAQVSIARPKKVYRLSPEGPIPTARVLLSLQPRHVPNLDNSRAVIRLVTTVAQEVAWQNVSVVTTEGRDITPDRMAMTSF